MRCLVAALGLLALPAVAFSQGLSVSLGGGMALSNYSGWPQESAEAVDFDIEGHRVGMRFGLSLAIPVAQSMDIVIGAVYAQHGDSGNLEYTDESPELSFEADMFIKSDYVSVPVLARYTDAPVNVFAGPYVGILVDCGISSSTENISFGLECDEESDLGFRTVNFGVVVGAGLTARVNGPVRVFLNGMYTLGLTNLFESEDSQLRAVTIEMGLSFVLK